MAKLINISICLTDIEKGRIQVAKNGKKYLGVTLSVNDDKDQYGNDVQLYHTQTKEERDAKAKRAYLGNGRVIWSSDATVAAAKEPAASVEVQANSVDDLPF
jgi:hypothetical protein